MRGLAITTLALLTGLVLAGCGNDTPEAGQAPGASPQGLTVAVRAAPTTFDPALATSLAARAVAVAVHTPLLTYRRTADADAAQLVPALAQALPELSDDGLQYRFNLRPGLLYSDGRLVKASDVERAISHASKVAADPELRAALATIQGAPSQDGQTLPGVRTDDRTGAIVVILRHGDGRIPLALADPATAPLPELPSAAKNSRELPASTGPLRIARVTAEAVELIANPLRARISTVPAAGVAQITLSRKIPTQAELQSGAIDVDLAPSAGPLAKGAAQVQGPTGLVVSLLLPTRGPFLERSVRRALAGALDRRELPPPVAAACGLLPDYVVGSVVRQPCPEAPTAPRSQPLAGQLITVAVPAHGPADATTASRPVALAAIEELGATVRLLAVDDPQAAVVDGRADAGVVQVAPSLPHPAGWLEPAASIDALLAREVPLQSEQALTGSSRKWAAFEQRAVDRPIDVPIAAGVSSVVIGSSVDRRSVILHPVLGPDLAALSLR